MHYNFQVFDHVLEAEIRFSSCIPYFIGNSSVTDDYVKDGGPEVV